MTPERWQHIKEVFYQALERPAAARASFVDSACAGDDEVRREVTQLLSAHEERDDFLNSPAFELAARSLAGGEPEGLAEGQALGHYRVIRSLGAGGMGEVYLAEDTRLRRRVAIKLLPSSLTGEPRRVRRFEQEARAASALNHPNVCTIHEVGEAEDGRRYIVMEYVEGVTLRERMSAGRLEVMEVLDVAIQTASGLAAAHAVGVVHRDVKPENVMLRPDGLVKVLDFGLAKLVERDAPGADPQAATLQAVQTEAGVVMGTALYMSPEQARAQEVDHRTDVWSLGVVLYEMAAGRAPFAGETPSHVIVSVLEHEPPPLSRDAEVPAGLEPIISKALCKDREERYQTAADLGRDLKALKEELEVEARLGRGREPAAAGDGYATGGAVRERARTSHVISAPVTASVEHLVGGIRRHKTLAAVALLGLLVGAVGLSYFITGRNKAGPGSVVRKSVAVLPLRPISATARDEIYEVGIADSLIHRLSSMKGFIVRPLSATRKYADVEQDPIAAGREQQVNYVLVSNYQLAGGKIRITAQLFNVGNGQIEETYKSEKDASDVFAMQDAIAGDVGRLLQARFAVTSGTPGAKRGTDNEEAYRLYLQGMYLADKHTLSSAQKAVEVLERAVEFDPDYAQAWAGKAYAHRVVANFIGGNVSTHEDYQKSMEAIERALSLDENLAEAYSTLCENKMYYEYDFAGAESACKRGIELNPNSPLAHQVYSRYLVSRGRFDEAITEIKTAIDLEPAALFYNSLYGINLYYARRYPEAVAQFKRMLAMDENFAHPYYWLNDTLAAQGNESEAFEIFMKLLAKAGKADEATIQAYRAAYQTSGWRGVMQEQAKRYEQSNGRYWEGAVYNAQAGNKDKALEYLEKSYQRREMWMAYLQVDPRLDLLRGDPRFDELVRRVELR